MPMRFLIETHVDLGSELTLDAQRAHYLCKVMRLTRGDTVDCFNGRGTAFSAELLTSNAKKCELRITHVEPVVLPVEPALHLGLSLLKGQAMDRALQQATELGARSISLISAQRSNVQIKDERTDNKLTHWRKIIAGACEQSGHLHLPSLSPPMSLKDLLNTSQAKVTVLDMHGETLPLQLEPQTRLILIGPEGGWDDGERDLFAQHDLPCFSINPGTLRAETTPAVALALFYHVSRS